MLVQINTDKNLDMNEAYSKQLEASLKESFNRYTDHITRLEVHLSDENGNKDSLDDKKCLIEARLKGKQPIVVSNLDNTYDQAVSGAIEKLRSSLDTIIGKSRIH